MAKKKTVVEEPQDEQAQDSAASLDGMEQSGSGPEYTEGVAGGQPAPGFGQGEAAPPSDDFPADDAPPFEEGPVSEAGWQDDPSGMGGDPSANGSEDYNELLKEVGSATPIQDDPLVLSDEDVPPLGPTSPRLCLRTMRAPRTPLGPSGCAASPRKYRPRPDGAMPRC